MGNNWAPLDPVAILVSIYLFVFSVAMLRKKFRLTFFDWLSMNDAFGLRFWSKNWWFLIFTLLVWVFAGILILRGGV